MTPYELLDRTRVLIRNAELSPLAAEHAQAQVIALLAQVRTIYREAHDASTP